MILNFSDEGATQSAIEHPKSLEMSVLSSPKAKKLFVEEGKR